jgi:hypothetical protein
VIGRQRKNTSNGGAAGGVLAQTASTPSSRNQVILASKDSNGIFDFGSVIPYSIWLSLPNRFQRARHNKFSVLIAKLSASISF